MKETFKQFNLSEELNKALADMEFTTPTAVQIASIDDVLKGSDVIVRAKTGSGKTAAFGLPIVERITPSNSPQALILTPTRELAIQVDNDIKRMSKYKSLNAMAVYGQHNIDIEIRELTKGADIVTGTPGRVLDHLERRTLYPQDIRYLVLDEADRMLDMGFIDQVMAIVKQMPKARQTLLFSATMPYEVQTIAWAHMKDPKMIEIESDTKTVDLIDQGYFKVAHNEKRRRLNDILRSKKPSSCIVFCNTRRTVDRVSEFLTQRGYTAQALHGALTQARRLKTINKFKGDKFRILVATDVAARGLHIDDLDMVINYDLPIEKDAYIHRIGRTGRAGNGGIAYSLVTSDDIMTLYEIEEHIGALIEELPLPKHTKKRRSQPKRSHDKRHKKHEGSATKHISRKVYQGKPQRSSATKINNTTKTHTTNGKAYSAARVQEIVAGYKDKPKQRKTLWQKIKSWFN